jgi:hypothetical protein
MCISREKFAEALETPEGLRHFAFDVAAVETDVLQRVIVKRRQRAALTTDLPPIEQEVGVGARTLDAKSAEEPA